MYHAERNEMLAWLAPRAAVGVIVGLVVWRVSVGLASAVEVIAKVFNLLK